MNPNTVSGNTAESPPRKPRRRWLRNTAIGIAIAGALGAVGVNSFAHGGGGWHRGGTMDAAAVDERLDRMLKHVYVEIDVTDAQKAKIDPIVKSAAKDLLPLRGKLREARGQAMALLTADTIDRNALEALRAEQLELANQASRRVTQAMGDLAEVLTPAQRRQIAEKIEKRRGRRHRG